MVEPALEQSLDSLRNIANGCGYVRINRQICPRLVAQLLHADCVQALSIQFFLEFVDLLADRAFVSHLALDFFNGVDGCGVVFAAQAHGLFWGTIGAVHCAACTWLSGAAPRCLCRAWVPGYPRSIHGNAWRCARLWSGR